MDEKNNSEGKKPGLLAVRYQRVLALYQGQRIDNYLFRELSGVPKSKIYNILRSGEIRVNSKRVKPSYKLNTDDQIRIPPIKLKDKKDNALLSGDFAWVAKSITYEDKDIILINKPSGLCVHGGSGVSVSLIAAVKTYFKSIKKDINFLDLCHRLDKNTSGAILLAKSPEVLKNLQNKFREKTIKKEYLTIVKDELKSEKEVKLALKKNIVRGMERVVKVDKKEGKLAISKFIPLVSTKEASLLKVIISTGRTHQIRVHASSIGHPIVGDTKYGDKEFNKVMHKLGIKTMCLHSYGLSFEYNKTFNFYVEPGQYFLDALKKLSLDYNLSK